MKEVKTFGLILLIIAILFLSGCTTPSNKNNNQQGNQNSLDSDHDGIPDTVEKTLGTDPFSNDTDGDGVSDLNDSTPTFVDNPPTPSIGPIGFTIQNIMVENNLPADHLELTLKSNITKDISNMTVYYIIKDVSTSKIESYLRPLTGFVLKANERATIHFDQVQELNHFRANPNSIYYKTGDELNFTVTVDAVGYAAQTAQVTRAAGGTEGPD